MHLIQRMKIWKELKRLEQRAREEPSPSTYVDLGQVYINLSMSDKALLAAQEGLALFPQSPELQKLRQFAQRSCAKARIDGLRDKLNRNPSPRIYRELACLLLEIGEFGAVETTCEECIVRFPQDSGAWLVLGQARLANFYRDLSAREGSEAVRCLARVIELDPPNEKAHAMLAEVYYRIGATSMARKHLEVLQATGQIDEAGQQLLRQANELPDAGRDVPALFQQVEEQGSTRNAAPSAKLEAGQAEQGIGRIRDALAQIAEYSGVRKATYIRGARALVKGAIRDGKDPFLRVLRSVAKASQRFARRMDIGNFSKGVLEGDFGHICICSYGEVVAAVQCDPDAAVDEILSDLQELVAASLYLTGATP